MIVRAHVEGGLTPAWCTAAAMAASGTISRGRYCCVPDLHEKLRNVICWPEAALAIHRPREIPNVRYRVASIAPKRTSLFPLLAGSGIGYQLVCRIPESPLSGDVNEAKADVAISAVGRQSPTRNPAHAWFSACGEWPLLAGSSHRGTVRSASARGLSVDTKRKERGKHLISRWPW